MGKAKREGFGADARAYRQLAHPVFMAVPPAKFLPGKSAKTRVVELSRNPPAPSPSQGPLSITRQATLRPHQPHPHSSWLPKIKGHDACVGRQRAPRGVCGGGEGLPVYRTQWRLRTETPRPQELEHRLQDPQGVHSLGPYLMAERRVSQGGSWSPPPHPQAHVLSGLFLPYLSGTPQIPAQESPQQEQKGREEAGSEGAQGSQEAVVSRVRVNCHLSPGQLCYGRWQPNLSGSSCL